uniref:Uncharacterized protein n=1 Tax=Arundo donax TaxID=35708 RepID=A0A0A9BAD7_ARUDO
MTSPWPATMNRASGLHVQANTLPLLLFFCTCFVFDLSFLDKYLSEYLLI